MDEQIDYSGVPTTQTGVVTSAWKPPRHVFFGKKDPNTGQMEDEPVYVHQDFPAFRYKKQPDGRIVAAMVNNVDEDAALDSAWVDSPGKLGLVTHPSFEQRVAAKNAPKGKA